MATKPSHDVLTLEDAEKRPTLMESDALDGTPPDAVVDTVVEGAAVKGAAVEGAAVEGTAVEGAAVEGAAMEGAAVGADGWHLEPSAHTLTLVLSSQDEYVPPGQKAPAHEPAEEAVEHHQSAGLPTLQEWLQNEQRSLNNDNAVVFRASSGEIKEKQNFCCKSGLPFTQKMV